MKKTAALLLSLFVHSFVCSAQLFPDFTLIGLNGDTLTSNNFIGKNIYINVFDVGCKPCIAEIPLLNTTQKNLSDVLIIAITPASVQKAQKFKTKYNLDLPVYADASELCKEIKANRYPGHFFVDSTGRFQKLYIPLAVKIEYDKNGKWNPSEKEWQRMMLEQNQTTIADAITKARHSPNKKK
jgi:peroxiredoxin